MAARKKSEPQPAAISTVDLAQALISRTTALGIIADAEKLSALVSVSSRVEALEEQVNQLAQLLDAFVKREQDRTS